MKRLSIGTKAAVLYALMDVDLDSLAARRLQLPDASLAGRIPNMVRLAVRFFTDRPDYYRPLMRYLLGVFEPGKRPMFMARAIAFWRVALSSTSSELPGLLTDARHEDVAQSLHLAFTGALDLWVHHEIDNAEFRRLMLRQAALLSSSLA